MGKDILERHIRFYFDDTGGTPRDLTGDLIPGTISGPGFSTPEIRMTGVSDGSEQYLADRKDSEITAQFYLNDTATTGAYTVIGGQEGGVGTLLVEFGTGAAPGTGDPTFSGEFVLLATNVVAVGGAMAMDARWRPASGFAAPVWGTKT